MIRALLPDVTGVEIMVSKLALKATQKRLFPASKNRSKRIHKKLLKRFGSEFEMVPTIWQLHRKIVMHPILYAEFQAHMNRRQEEHP